MGTQANHYVIFGYSIPYSNSDVIAEILLKYADNAYEVAKNGTFVVLDDGRDGKYCLMGICIAATKDDDVFNGVVTCTITKSKKKLLEEKIEELKSQLPKSFQFDKHLAEQKPRFHVVSPLR